MTSAPILLCLAAVSANAATITTSPVELSTGSYVRALEPLNPPPTFPGGSPNVIEYSLISPLFRVTSTSGASNNKGQALYFGFNNSPVIGVTAFADPSLGFTSPQSIQWRFDVDGAGGYTGFIHLSGIDHETLAFGDAIIPVYGSYVRTDLILDHFGVQSIPSYGVEYDFYEAPEPGGLTALGLLCIAATKAMGRSRRNRPPRPTKAAA